MNGAEALARTLAASGVDVCFANPGTSEMHFVSALDRVAGLRCVLGLAETVVSGCADGYARMAGKPAATDAAPTPLATWDRSLRRERTRRLWDMALSLRLALRIVSRDRAARHRTRRVG